jgi:hypothetical protein
MLPNERASVTAEGTILGTLQYMAPEQPEGRDADARTDLFAFGAVVYEMATGRKAFCHVARVRHRVVRPSTSYEPKCPAQSALYQIVVDHFETFRARAACLRRRRLAAVRRAGISGLSPVRTAGPSVESRSPRRLCREHDAVDRDGRAGHRIVACLFLP